jgi:hypothetical protein
MDDGGLCKGVSKVKTLLSKPQRMDDKRFGEAFFTSILMY